MIISLWTPPDNTADHLGVEYNSNTAVSRFIIIIIFFLALTQNMTLRHKSKLITAATHLSNTRLVYLAT